MTHHPDPLLNTLCGRPGPIAADPTCPDCKDIRKQHPYLSLPAEQRREMAELVVAGINPPERR